MDNSDDLDFGVRILPGIDLTLWLRLVVLLVVLAAVGGITLAA